MPYIPTPTTTDHTLLSEIPDVLPTEAHVHALRVQSHADVLAMELSCPMPGANRHLNWL